MTTVLIGVYVVAFTCEALGVLVLIQELRDGHRRWMALGRRRHLVATDSASVTDAAFVAIGKVEPEPPIEQ